MISLFALASSITGWALVGLWYGVHHGGQPGTRISFANFEFIPSSGFGEPVGTGSVVLVNTGRHEVRIVEADFILAPDPQTAGGYTAGYPVFSGFNQMHIPTGKEVATEEHPIVLEPSTAQTISVFAPLRSVFDRPNPVRDAARQDAYS